MYNSFSKNSKCCKPTLIVGPIGPQGAQGPIGPYGHQGFQGPRGPQGPQGPCCIGPTGAQGPQGYAGGATGATGPAGQGSIIQFNGSAGPVTIGNTIAAIYTFNSALTTPIIASWAVSWSIQENTFDSTNEFYIEFQDIATLASTYMYINNIVTPSYLPGNATNSITSGSGNDVILNLNASTFNVTLYQVNPLVPGPATIFFNITLTML